jgi:hypothetical protein
LQSTPAPVAAPLPQPAPQPTDPAALLPLFPPNQVDVKFQVVREPERAPHETASVAPPIHPPPAEAPPLFTSANKTPGQVTPVADWDRIVETVYAVDPWKEYEELERHLEIGDERNDVGTLKRALDRSSRLALRAHQLYLAAKLHQTNVELDTSAIWTKMRDEATAALEAEKKTGDRKKQITESDVENEIVARFGDEYRAQRTKREKLKGMVAQMLWLAERWKGKEYAIAAMLEPHR